MYSSNMRCRQLRWNGCAPLFEERLVVVGADAEDLHAAGVDELAERVDEPVPLQLPLVAMAGRERQSGGPQCPKTATPMSCPSRGEYQR